MPDRSPARAILGGAAVVLLSGVAAFVGATLARPEAPPAAPPSAAADPATLESIDRRIGYLEKRVELIDQMTRTALELARTLEDRARTSAPVPGAAAPPASVEPASPRAATSTEPPAESSSDDLRERQMAKLAEIGRETTKNRVVYSMGLMTDATEEGIANRRAQAYAEASAFMRTFGITGDEAYEQIRRTFLDHWDRAARDIGPIVHDGLEKADIATVRRRLADLYAATDERLRPHFDEEKWKRYEASAEGMRKAEGQVLDEFEKTRLRK